MDTFATQVIVVSMTGCYTRVPKHWIHAEGNEYETTTGCSPNGEPVGTPGWNALLDVNQRSIEVQGLGFYPDPNFIGFCVVFWDGGHVVLPFTGKVISPTKLELTIDVSVANVTYKGKIYLSAKSKLEYILPPWLNCWMVKSTSLNPNVESWIAKYVDGVCKKKLVFTSWSGNAG